MRKCSDPVFLRFVFNIDDTLDNMEEPQYPIDEDMRYNLQISDISLHH